MQDAITALDVYEKSKTCGEVLLKALGLHPVKVSHITLYFIYIHHSGNTQNILWIVAHSDPHDAISLDRLHALHLGIWKHLFNELKKILKYLGHEAESLFEEG